MFKLSVDDTPSCTGMDIELFYPKGEEQAKRAGDYRSLRQTCANCPVLTKCRDWAVKHEDYGFWGGMSTYERRVYREENNIQYSVLTGQTKGKR